jgi:hypothetical protein
MPEYIYKYQELLRELIKMETFDYMDLQKILGAPIDTKTRRPAKDYRDYWLERGLIERVDRDGSHRRARYRVNYYYKVMVLNTHKAKLSDLIKNRV